VCSDTKSTTRDVKKRKRTLFALFPTRQDVRAQRFPHSFISHFACVSVRNASRVSFDEHWSGVVKRHCGDAELSEQICYTKLTRVSGSHFSGRPLRGIATKKQSLGLASLSHGATKNVGCCAPRAVRLGTAVTAAAERLYGVQHVTTTTTPKNCNDATAADL